MDEFEVYLKQMTTEQKVEFLIFLQTLIEGTGEQPLSGPGSGGTGSP